MYNQINIQELESLNEKQLSLINTLENILENLRAVLKKMPCDSAPFNLLCTVISDFERQKDDLFIQCRKLTEIINVYRQCSISDCDYTEISYTEAYDSGSYRIWSDYFVSMPDEKDLTIDKLAFNEEWLNSKIFEFFKNNRSFF